MNQHRPPKHHSDDKRIGVDLVIRDMAKRWIFDKPSLHSKGKGSSEYDLREDAIHMEQRMMLLDFTTRKLLFQTEGSTQSIQRKRNV